MNIYATKTETFKRFITGVLSSYSATISNEAKLNFQNGTTSSEEALMWLINKAFCQEFEDANKVFNHNYPGIDYIDRHNKVVMQVTATANNKKFRDSIDKMPENLKLNGYKDFYFFINSTNRRIEYSHQGFDVKVFDIKDLIFSLCTAGPEDRKKIVAYLEENFSNWIPSSSSELFLPQVTTFKRNHSLFKKFIEVNKLGSGRGFSYSDNEWLREQCENDLYHFQKKLSELSMLQRNFICMVYQYGFVNGRNREGAVSEAIQLNLAQYATHFTEEEAERFDDIYYGLYKWNVCEIIEVFDSELFDSDNDSLPRYKQLNLKWFNWDVNYNLFRAIGNFYMARYDESELYRAIRSNNFVLIY
jgi:hypothetical protein